MTTRTYKNPLTLDGRLRVVPGVSATKVKAVKTLVEKHLSGDFIATGTLTEALTTSDAMFNLAHLSTLNFVGNYDEAERTWSDIAGTRTVPDFKPVTLYSLFNNGWTDGDGETGVLGAHGEAPVIPEGNPYPYAYISGQEAAGAAVQKRGFKTDWTLEARINDGLGALERLPEEMNQVALDTESADVWGALVTQKTAESTLDGGPVPTPVGTATVPANAPLSINSVTRAIIELSERTINGRKVQVRGGYNLIVPVGQAIFVNAVLFNNLTQVNSNPAAGTPEFVWQVNNQFNPLASVTVMESEWVTGAEWYLLPKKGTTVRPVLEHLELRGYQTPQLFVQNASGVYVGGASVSPFEGSFDTDVITLKLRQFGGGVLWDQGRAVVYSTGAGS